jgi:hypothetical protein
VQLAEGQVGNVEVDDDGLGRRLGQHRRHHDPRHLRRRLPPLPFEHLVPALALDAEALDGLADGQAADSAEPGRQRGTDRSGVVHRPAHVGPRVDPGDDQVEGRAEHAEARVVDAQRGGSADGPRLLDPVERPAVDLGPDLLEGPERGAGAGVLGVRCDHHHVGQR